MGLRTELEAGGDGVTLRFPAAWPTVDETEHSFTVRGDAVAIVVTRLPWPVSFEGAELEAVRADAEVEARDWVALEAESDEHDDRSRPRTRGEVAPLVECELLGGRGARFLRVIHRLAMRPGRETVQGVFVMPLDTESLHVRMIARDDVTGFREVVLVELAMRSAGGASDPADLQQLVSQIAFDDPKHDADFPQHALSRVRAAQRALLDGTGGMLSIASMPLPPDEDEVALPQAYCALRVPARFRYVRPEVMGMAPRLVSFTKLTLFMIPRMAEVWWTGKRVADGNALADLARKTVEAWSDEGASEIDAETSRPRALEARGAGLDGATCVDLDVRFRTRNGPVRARQRWIALARGDVIRLATSGTPGFTAEELERELAVMTNTLRVDPPPAVDAPPPPRRPWWRFW